MTIPPLLALSFSTTAGLLFAALKNLLLDFPTEYEKQKNALVHSAKMAEQKIERFKKRLEVLRIAEDRAYQRGKFIFAVWRSDSAHLSEGFSNREIHDHLNNLNEDEGRVRAMATDSWGSLEPCRDAILNATARERKLLAEILASGGFVARSPMREQEMLEVMMSSAQINEAIKELTFSVGLVCVEQEKELDELKSTIRTAKNKFLCSLLFVVLLVAAVVQAVFKGWL